MENYQLKRGLLVKTFGSSIGAQPKYYKNGYWYKENFRGYEAKSEWIVSQLLSCSDVPYYVVYEECQINGKNGCRSKSFTSENETFVSFQKLYSTWYGGELEGYLTTLESPEERIEFVKTMLLDNTGLDITSYLSQTLTLDMITLNPDRHMNNLGLIYNAETEQYRTAPIFDNGAALCSNLGHFPPDLPLDELIEKVSGRPFSSSLELQAHVAGFGLKINIGKFQEIIHSVPQHRAISLLEIQLKKYRHIVELT